MANYNLLLYDWLANHPGNVSWLSHDLQNELLQLTADEVVSNTITKCAGKMYSIMCDEVSDRANNELMSLSRSGVVPEALVTLIDVEVCPTTCYIPCFHCHPLHHKVTICDNARIHCNYLIIPHICQTKISSLICCTKTHTRSRYSSQLLQ